MGKFGWSMPPGAWESTLPGEEPDFSPPHCSACGAFLRLAADHYEETEVREDDYSDHKPTYPVENLTQIESPWGPGYDPWYSFTRVYTERTPITVCRRCGANNRGEP